MQVGFVVTLDISPKGLIHTTAQHTAVCQIIPGVKLITYNPSVTQIPDRAFLLTSIPSETPRLPAQDDFGLNQRAECILSKSLAVKTVFSSVKFPAPMPNP